MLDLLGQGQRAYEIGQVVGQGVRLEPHGGGRHRAALVHRSRQKIQSPLVAYAANVLGLSHAGAPTG